MGNIYMFDVLLGLVFIKKVFLEPIRFYNDPSVCTGRSEMRSITC